jgi:hypothetical protein
MFVDPAPDEIGHVRQDMPVIAERPHGICR